MSYGVRCLRPQRAQRSAQRSRARPQDWPRALKRQASSKQASSDRTHARREGQRPQEPWTGEVKGTAQPSAALCAAAALAPSLEH